MPQRDRVLLVTASPDEREMYAEHLQRRGFCTLQADSAADAMRLARELPPAVVVTGVRLAGPEDGLTLTRQLKQDSATRGVPVVMLTGYVFNSDRDAAARAGCDRFISKPCLPDSLAHVIQSAIAAGQRRRNVVHS